jgi:hypothetical protein
VSGEPRDILGRFQNETARVTRDAPDRPRPQVGKPRDVCRRYRYGTAYSRPFGVPDRPCPRVGETGNVQWRFRNGTATALGSPRCLPKCPRPRSASIGMSCGDSKTGSPRPGPDPQVGELRGAGVDPGPPGRRASGRGGNTTIMGGFRTANRLPLVGLSGIAPIPERDPVRPSCAGLPIQPLDDGLLDRPPSLNRGTQYLGYPYSVPSAARSITRSARRRPSSR